MVEEHTSNLKTSSTSALPHAKIRSRNNGIHSVSLLTAKRLFKSEYKKSCWIRGSKPYKYAALTSPQNTHIGKWKTLFVGFCADQSLQGGILSEHLSWRFRTSASSYEMLACTSACYLFTHLFLTQTPQRSSVCYQRTFQKSNPPPQKTSQVTPSTSKHLYKRATIYIKPSHFP